MATRKRMASTINTHHHRVWNRSESPTGRRQSCTRPILGSVCSFEGPQVHTRPRCTLQKPRLCGRRNPGHNIKTTPDTRQPQNTGSPSKKHKHMPSQSTWQGNLHEINKQENAPACRDCCLIEVSVRLNASPKSVIFTTPAPFRRKFMLLMSA